MDKFLDFPKPPRVMADAEGRQYFDNMVQQIAQFNPGEVIAVNRSGFSYAMWVAQQLKLPMGAYWPKQQRLVRASSSKKIVFVDDNTVAGETYLTCKQDLGPTLRNEGIEWKWAVLFTDWHTPKPIRDEVIQGVRLPYFAEEPMWGSMKVSQDYGVRFRDEK